MNSQSAEWPAATFTVLVGLAIAYLFFLRKSNNKEEVVTPEDLRGLRSKRLEQHRSKIAEEETFEGDPNHYLQESAQLPCEGISKTKIHRDQGDSLVGATTTTARVPVLGIETPPDERRSPANDKTNGTRSNLGQHSSPQHILESPHRKTVDSRPFPTDPTKSGRVHNHDSSTENIARRVSNLSIGDTLLDEPSLDMSANKRRKAQPAIQDLCQEISAALSICVQPKPSQGSEWNGTEGWAKSSKTLSSQRSSTVLELPFASYDPQTVTNDDVWDRLYQALQAMSLAEPQIIVPTKVSMSWVAKAYGQLRTTSNRPELNRCLKLVQSWICKVATVAIEAEMKDEQNDHNMPGLFADEVTESEGSSSGLIGQLITMLENFSISSPCLDSIFENAVQSPALVAYVLSQLMKRLEDDAFSGLSVLETISRRLQRINAVGNFMQSRTIQIHVAVSFTKEVEGNGRDAEKRFPMHQLFRLAAYTLPVTVPALQRESFMSCQFEDTLAVESTTCAEIAVFSKKGIKGYNQFQKQSRQLMESARAVCRTVIERSMRASKGANKGKVFQWLLQLAEVNQPLTKMLSADLLSSDGIVSISSSWPFLNGLVCSLISICVNRLRDEFESKKLSAFDHRFLTSESFRAIFSGSSGLSQQSISSEVSRDASTFDGTTKFFFVITSVLHTSLYPMMRVEGSFRAAYNKPLMQLQAMAADPQAATGFQSSPVTKCAVRGWIGWGTFFEDPAIVGDMVNFALLQLQWLLELMKEQPCPGLAYVPDWMCKEPARWLTHVAGGQSLFIPHQAELTIELATRLLAAGSVGKAGGSHASKGAQFSPVVLAELIHVVSAFVRSGIRKATKRDRGRDSKRIVDERSLYLSLDKRNLSTYVYTNELVAKQLCPVLMATFQVLDHVEGLNVDAEASFDKYSVKSEICRLLLILWGHPYDSRCKNSMISLADADLAKFVASVALVVGMLFDDGHQRFVDVCKSLKKPRLTQQETVFMERQKDRATNAFMSSRAFLLLLWKLCLDPKLAAIMGGTEEAARDLAAMTTTVLGLIVQSDGAFHGEIDTISLSQRSTEILIRMEKGEFEPQSIRKMVSTLVAHRQSVKKEYGLDVSLLACTLLAIVAQSTEACLKTQQVSPLVESLARQDDCDIEMLRNLVKRYFPGGEKMNSIEEDILRQDGNVGPDVWVGEASDGSSQLSGTQKHRLENAARDHTSLEEITNNVRRGSVLKLIDAIEEAKKKNETKNGLAHIDPTTALRQIFASSTRSVDKDYTELLSEWVVSSHSFSSKDAMDGSLSHAFGNVLRTHATTAPGKVLVKEARKCHKNIPPPHPNSAVYVCFAEERMDICKCLITGPVDTPYAFGAFEFDVFFPSSYPNIPPLVQFMTTGGGRVRFGPNLYLDGKVCLSLLGTFNAQDTTQQWNPKESSLPQVLLSIQTQLLTEDPYFNEPGHETMRHTSAGREASRSYNLKRSLDTLRFAIVEPLTNPTVGFEEITYRHFALCRQQIVVQARLWLMDAKGTELEKRFATVFDRLVIALENLPQEMKSKYPPLPPRQEDVGVLSRNGDALCSFILQTEEQKHQTESVRRPMQNPWAASNSNSQARDYQSGGKGDADIEDFYS